MQNGANPNSYRANFANAASCYCYAKHYHYCSIKNCACCDILSLSSLCTPWCKHILLE